MIKLDIFSDPICPWCYIGHSHLSKAAAMLPEAGIRYRHLPFFLNPGMPKQGMSRSDYLSMKFGSDSPRILSVIETAAELAGIQMNLDMISVTPNTMDAQRLILWADEEDMRERVVKSLFESYFRDGRDIGDRRVLLDIASACKMNPDRIYAKLLTEEGCKPIASQARNARRAGITGVPFYIVNDVNAISGSQPTSSWVSMFQGLEATRSQGDTII